MGRAPTPEASSTRRVQHPAGAQAEHLLVTAHLVPDDLAQPTGLGGRIQPAHRRRSLQSQIQGERHADLLGSPQVEALLDRAGLKDRAVS